MVSRRSSLAMLGVALGSMLVPLSCVGSTGGDLLDLQAFAAGPRDAVAGSPYVFVSGRGFQVRLTRAKLHIGAVYLNRSRPTSVSSETVCTLAGIYVAEVPGPVDVDVLDPRLQPFSVKGRATTDFAPTGEIWLSGGDVNSVADPTVILDVAGTASRDGVDYPFEGALTIGENRVPEVLDAALPGAKPICKERVVSPIDTSITPTVGGKLVVRVSPQGWFANVDFSRLEKVGDVFRFHDASDDQPSTNLFLGLRSSAGSYDFEWAPASTSPGP